MTCYAYDFGTTATSGTTITLTTTSTHTTFIVLPDLRPWEASPKAQASRDAHARMVREARMSKPKMKRQPRTSYQAFARLPNYRSTRPR